MTDNKYIREAVELADGWEWKHSIQGTVVRWNIDNSLQMMQWPEDNLPIWIKDALAAQLVRQVDSQRSWQFDSDIWGAAQITNRPQIRASVRVIGPDRTMNSIKAIVDSKVLK